MTQDLRWRLGGLLSLVVSAASAWYFLLIPLHQAQAGAPRIEMYMKTALVLPPATLIYGLVLLIGGERARPHVTSRSPSTHTPLGWALLALTFVAAIGCYLWAQAQFAALGYRL